MGMRALHVGKVCKMAGQRGRFHASKLHSVKNLIHNLIQASFQSLFNLESPTLRHFEEGL